jgi:hypothetical protein
LSGDLRAATTFGFLCACLDLRFPANWFLLTIFVVDKVTGVFLYHEAVNTSSMFGLVIYLGRFWPLVPIRDTAGRPSAIWRRAAI